MGGPELAGRSKGQTRLAGPWLGSPEKGGLGKAGLTHSGEMGQGAGMAQ